MAKASGQIETKQKNTKCHHAQLSRLLFWQNTNWKSTQDEKGRRHQPVGFAIKVCLYARKITLSGRACRFCLKCYHLAVIVCAWMVYLVHGWPGWLICWFTS